MDILLYLFIFFLGLAVGSFLNCVIYRIELQENEQEDDSSKKSQSFLQGRSFCPYCRHTLSWQDLIPVLSFIFLRGKCRYCQKPISFQYPAVEIATGLLFLLIFNLSTKDFLLCSAEHSNLFECSGLEFFTLLYYLTISSLLIIIFVYDLKHYIIPDKIVFPAIGIALLYQFFIIWNLPALLEAGGFPSGFGNWKLEIGNLEPLLPALLSALGAAGFFLLIVLISRGRWMGVGDIKLAFLMGLVLGWPNIFVALFSAFLIGAIIGIALMILGKKTLKSEVPFGPFLVTGTFLALFWGRQIIDFYVQRIYPVTSPW